VISIYRAGKKVSDIDKLKELNVLPYVFTCPQPDAEIYPGDRIFVFSHPDVITEVLNELKLDKQNRSSPVSTMDRVTLALPSNDRTVSASRNYEMKYFLPSLSGGVAVKTKETDEDDQNLIEVL
jgi:hypothetical protein